MTRRASAAPDSIPAVQYLRMSTEHQRYSMENQAAAIAAYALSHGYSIVGTYADPGRSGLTLAGRPGLGQLLSDVLQPDRKFAAVLVLDVSRWGRFQDPDQAAHYEFICRAAGAPVLYCAEPFENDGAFASTIIKHLKRVMAGEYSRELSDKVLQAQRRQAGYGFKQGGGRAYGVRRVLVDEHGKVRLELKDGERKAMRGERVRFVRGPPEEVRTVRRIFRLYAERRWTMNAIAELLNREGVPSNQGRPWTYGRIRSVLSSEMALGVYVFSRWTKRMKAKQQLNPPEEWVRVRVMAPIVPRAVFEAAARRLAAGRPCKFEEEEMLLALARLLEDKGHLSAGIINRCPYTCGATAYRDRFGSLAEAYRRVGFQRGARWRPSAGGERPATDEEVLELLRDLSVRRGRVTARIVREDKATPSVELYTGRFGSFSAACRLAGLTPAPRRSSRTAAKRP